MKLQFFKNIKTKDELRKAFIELLKQHHPDKGGDLETCKALNNEYDFLFKKFNASEYSNVDSKMSYKEADDLDEEIAKILNSIIGMEVRIEIIGYWIWVSGDTFNYKEYLKELGFRWSSNKKSWYKSMIDTGYRKFSKYKNMDELRENFRVVEIKTKKKAKISA